MNTRWLVAPLMICIACGDSSKDEIEETDTPIVEPTDTTDEPPVEPDPLTGLTAPEQVIAVANVDDDDGDLRFDWVGKRIRNDNEAVEFVVTPSENGANYGATELSFRLNEFENIVRVWYDGEILLDFQTTEATLPWQAEPVTLAVEFRTANQVTTLEVTEKFGAEPDGATQSIELLSSPMLLNHHLQPTEQVYAVSFPEGSPFGSNQAMIDAYEEVLGDVFVEVDAQSAGFDQWIQDEVEFATISAPGHHVELAIDSIRDRGLDGWVKGTFQYTADSRAVTYGPTNTIFDLSTSQDSFGNLEVSPPVTVDGVEYPFGRIYYGAIESSNYGPTPYLTEKLAEQVLQAPFVLDASWLCVGHVDEWLTFVPDASSDKGFKLVFTDIDLGYELLEEMDPETVLARYAADFGFNTVGDIVDDEGLLAYNEDLKEDYVLPTLEVLKTELGLTDDDIVLIPGIFEPVPGCGTTGAALMPGMANLVVANPVDEPVHIFTADPFLRDEATQTLADDPYASAFEEVMPEGTEVHFVDDWDVYHVALGEVHCGTNVIRTPAEGWWTKYDTLEER